ncbi:3-hydroxyisobutyryl-CoA hydrolase, mitochondrial-like [Haliotis rubra]|uniref:3-hydroxyisobutyryl-CoA hydrolase, mitochondrial-like n=1 Tax=Haliotis rubra TaxID=36100 RepID=UPI001EE4F2A2|nr:3-hydroxyisobutyryl-CoA hydrolase, mitochondrial-like [Haliotis rubra]
MFRGSVRRLRVILNHVKMFSSATDEVLFESVGDKRVVVLNRPKALNSLNLSMVRKIYSQMKSWESDPAVSMVIMKGTGDKAFCAGGDVRAVTEAGRSGDLLSREFFFEEYILNNKIGNYKLPYIAMIDGITMGGGVGLSVHGMFRVATERTLFAMPETAIGLFPDVGGGHFLPRLRGEIGTFLALTGFRLKGQDVEAAGIATHFVNSQQLPDLENALMELQKPQKSDIAQVLDQFHKQSSDPQRSFVLKPHLNSIDTLFGANTLENMFLNLEKDGSEWAVKQLSLLKKMSPTSMKITLRQLREGAAMTLQQVLNMEYRLSQRCLEDKDFYEGVRAVLVDKDNSPVWNPASIQEVSQEKVDWYFSPLPPDRELVL